MRNVNRTWSCGTLSLQAVYVPSCSFLLACIGVPPTGLRRRSLDAVRFFARKTQQICQHPAHDWPVPNSSPSPTVTSRATMWTSMSRIPRRRSLSMTWSMPLEEAGCNSSTSGLLLQQIAFMSKRAGGEAAVSNGGVVRYGAIAINNPAAETRGGPVLHHHHHHSHHHHGRKRLKSTIPEERTSQMDPTTTTGSESGSSSSGCFDGPATSIRSTPTGSLN